MTFLVDAQLPPVLVQFLRAAGHGAQHVADIKMLNAVDGDIWRHADSSGAVIVTKDEDFALRAEIHSTGPQIVWLRVGNCSNRALMRWFQPLFSMIADRLQRGERLIEVI